MIRILAALSLTSFSLHAQSPATTQRLTTLRAAYEAAYQKEVAAPHQQAVADLDAKYTSALERALTAATQAGQLDTALALRDEIKRLKEAKPLPADDFAAPETLKTLRLTYRSALTNLVVRLDQSAAPVKAKYDAALEALQTELTKAADLDGAVAVKTLREGLKNELAPAPPKASPAPEKVATGGDEKSAELQLAEWVFSVGKEVRVYPTGESTSRLVRNAADLPQAGWRLYAVVQGSATPTPPPSFPWEMLPKVPGLVELGVNQASVVNPDQIRHVGSLPKLSYLDLGNCKVSVEALEAIQVGPAFQRLRLGTLVGQAAPAMAAIIHRLPKLQSLEINFPITLDLIPDGQTQLPELRELGIRGSLTPEIIAKVAAIPKLHAFSTQDFRDASPPPDLLLGLKNKVQFFKFRRCLAYATLLPSLKEFSKLTYLEIAAATIDTIRPADLEPLATLQQIEKLRLDGGAGSGLSDDLVGVLSRLTFLKNLELANSRISPEAMARLRKALPDCKITP